MDQKISILHGNGNSSPYIGNLTGIPALCIPNLGLQDGPVGVGDGLGGVTQLPSAVTVGGHLRHRAASSSTARRSAPSSPARARNVALGPTLNIVRDPRWGRAFETFSEDPYLTGQMAAADIRGIQSQGVMAQAKHAAVYNQETNRNGAAGQRDRGHPDAAGDLPARRSRPRSTKGATASVMCAYSTVNGTYACQNPYLLNTALYQQAGFGGFVTSRLGRGALDGRRRPTPA